MPSKAFMTLPPSASASKIQPFQIEVPSQDVSDLKQLLKLSRITKATYESTQGEVNFGLKRDWMEDVVGYWRDEFSWEKQQTRLNGIPQYKTTVQNANGKSYDIHFAALFSTKSSGANDNENAGAMPIIFSHGWPGSFVEFVPMMEMIQKRYKEDDLPYHIIVPSLPGYLFSSPPPLDKEFSIKDVAYLFNSLMTDVLGFREYTCQGGDIGSYVSWRIARDFEQCVALHVNFASVNVPPEGTPERAKLSPPPQPPAVIQGMNKFGYALEQATRPATIGFTVGSNPISLLAWIGEKYSHGSDIKPSKDDMLTFLSLYWFTDCYATGIWFYRYVMGIRAGPDSDPLTCGGYLSKPLGYSLFPKEIAQTPPHWVEKLGNLVWSKVHKDKGGHFAAWERPDQVWEDVLAFMSTVQGSSGNSGPESGAAGKSGSSKL